jgi:hypothetical protein
MQSKPSKAKADFIHYAAFIAAVALAVGSVFLHKDTFDPASENGALSHTPARQIYQNRDTLSVERYLNEQSAPKIAFEKGQKVITTLTLDKDFSDEQVVAYHNENEFEGRIFFTQIKFDQKSGEYIRVMDVPSAANVPDTAALFPNDLVGDHSVCVLLTGMNTAGEHTLTIFRKPDDAGAFAKIGEFAVDGTISVLETDRGVNYERGVTNGVSFAIATRGRDTSSSNEMDKLEITYRYNPELNRYEQDSVTSIPGAVIENQRQREILSGSRARFEEFIFGLWYLVSPEGTVDTRQYVYIDPANKEIIFYADDRQEVFSWLSASSSRYGLYLVANNIAVTTLRRYVDIELESLDSIRLKVVEDVRMKIEVNAQWDGSYRKAPLLKNRPAAGAPPIDAFIEKEFESSIGRVIFNGRGVYRIETGGVSKTGKYVFFTLGPEELLELRPESASGAERVPREVYAVARDGAGMVLSRVRIGVRTIERYREPAIALYEKSAG